jgi:hypothetical protein
MYTINGQDYLSINEAAQQIGMTPDRLRKMCRNYHELGGFEPDDLQWHYCRSIRVEMPVPHGYTWLVVPSEVKRLQNTVSPTGRPRGSANRSKKQDDQE